MSLYSDSIEIYELNLKYVLMKGSDAEILNQIELAKEKFPKNKVNFLTLEVNFYLERGDDVKALKALRQTIDNMQSDDPLLSELYFNSGLLLFTIAQDTKDEKNKAVLFSESKEMFTKVIEIDSKYAAAYVSLANFDLVEANALVKKANDLPLSKQKEFDLLQKASYASFNKAAEYLEKAYEIQASESTRETLILIYTKVGNLSRVSELKK
jgi:tetratricopeptide (TPR) repeat protein